MTESRDSWSYVAKDVFRGKGPAILILVLMVGIYSLGSWLWNGGLDKTGWISHDHDTPVWIQGNWIIGEYRTCQMRTTEPLARKSLLRLSPESLAKLPRLFCGTGTEGLIDFEIAKSTDSNDGLAVENDDWVEVSEKYFHVLPVTYWGRIDREEDRIFWRCQRNESSLTCKAVN